MIVGGVDERGLLQDVTDEDTDEDTDEAMSESAPSVWWEQWLCGRRTGMALLTDALRAVQVNLAFELLGLVALVWTLCTEQPRWVDVWDGVDLLLALPTLLALLSYSADPPPELARWCWVLLSMYAANVAVDIVVLLLGRSSKVPSRAVIALTDAGSLCMWMQCVYYNQELVRALAVRDRHENEL